MSRDQPLTKDFCNTGYYSSKETSHFTPFHRYNITSDSWEDLSQKLEVARAYATAIPIPDDLAGCDKGSDTGAALMEDAYDEYLRSA